MSKSYYVVDIRSLIVDFAPDYNSIVIRRNITHGNAMDVLLVRSATIMFDSMVDSCTY